MLSVAMNVRGMKLSWLQRKKESSTGKKWNNHEKHRHCQDFGRGGAEVCLIVFGILCIQYSLNVTLDEQYQIGKK